MPDKKKTQEPTRADRFFGAFLLTENGKPKSSFLIYTFCLSFVLMAVYALIEWLIIDLSACLNFLNALNAAVGNTLLSLVFGLVGGAVCNLPNLFLKDKRLVFGAHLWLIAYVLFCTIAMAFIMNASGNPGWSGFWNFAKLVGWFAVIPLIFGILIAFRFYRRAPKPEKHEPEPEWKKYVNRR